jgi:hypothetical protein
MNVIRQDNDGDNSKWKPFLSIAESLVEQFDGFRIQEDWLTAIRNHREEIHSAPDKKTMVLHEISIASRNYHILSDLSGTAQNVGYRAAGAVEFHVEPRRPQPDLRLRLLRIQLRIDGDSTYLRADLISEIIDTNSVIQKGQAVIYRPYGFTIGICVRTQWGALSVKRSLPLSPTPWAVVFRLKFFPFVRSQSMEG